MIYDKDMKREKTVFIYMVFPEKGINRVKI